MFQLDHWKLKVDRTCIERIRAFQNPPALIGQIMDMIMVLIGKKKTSTAMASAATMQSSTTAVQATSNDNSKNDSMLNQASGTSMNKEEKPSLDGTRSNQVKPSKPSKFVVFANHLEADN